MPCPRIRRTTCLLFKFIRRHPWIPPPIKLTTTFFGCFVEAPFPLQIAHPYHRINSPSNFHNVCEARFGHCWVWQLRWSVCSFRSILNTARLTFVQWPGSWSESPRCTWVLCTHGDNGSNSPEHPRSSGRLCRSTWVCEEANQRCSGRCRSRCSQIR